jgi:hypothetical protein
LTLATGLRPALCSQCWELRIVSLMCKICFSFTRLFLLQSLETASGARLPRLLLLSLVKPSRACLSGRAVWALVCGRLVTGLELRFRILPEAWIDVCLLRVLCVVRYRPHCGADHSSRGFLPSVCVCDRVASMMRPWPSTGCCAIGKKSGLGFKLTTHLV